MATVLNPYVNFRGNARQAMEFYQSVLGGELRLQTYRDFGASQSPDEDNQVMHAQLDAGGGVMLMAADLPQRMEYQPGNNFSLSLSGDDEAQLRGCYDKLADGGTVTMPLAKAQWGDTFGMCVDRFGVSWLVNINANVGAAQG
jgi:PhnB protein